MTVKNSFPLISIVIPTYRRHASQVKGAILSALNQTYENIEIIVVDDNAQKENRIYREEILALIKSLNSSKILTILNKTNLGGSLSRNAGINASHGMYVSFLDDDDEYLPKKILNQYMHIITNDLDISISDMYIYNEKNKIIDIRNLELLNFENLQLKKYHFTKQLVGTPRFLFKREVLESVGGFDNALMGQEWFLINKIIDQNKYKFGYIPICDIKVYRTKCESISNSKNKLLGESKIYQEKLKGTKYLSKKEIRYLKFRHYVILCIANKRNHKFLQFCRYCFMIITHFPLNVIKEIKNSIKVQKLCKKLNRQ